MWLLAALLAAVSAATGIAERRANRRERRARAERRASRPAYGWQQPPMQSIVHYLGCEGSTILLESPRGVELALDGDTWTLDDAIIYLAQVDAL